MIGEKILPHPEHHLGQNIVVTYRVAVISVSSVPPASGFIRKILGGLDLRVG
ncbi:hypothetical protein [Corynebacterium dentalis]|uniref:hypothetical protein n=1 Tax=Corynebacterium dentalis TaxID=2014528 RepID=UPI00289BB1B1|nr:hypothetical protein [Corynebacterium dentalis]